MPAVILNIKEDLELDRMESADWLDLATNKEKDALALVHGNIATDGTRLHATLYGDDCSCSNPEDIHNKINHLAEVVEKDCKFAFIVNRQLLIDALAGMDDGLVFYCGTPTQPIVIAEREGTRFAVVMPMQPKDESETPNRPDLPRVNVHKGPRPDDGKLFPY